MISSYIIVNLLSIFLVFQCTFKGSVAIVPSTTESSPEQQHLPDYHKRPDTLAAIVDALGVLQTEYFQIWPGVWPTSIDWTGAVIGTSLSGVLSTFLASITVLSSQTIAENLLNKYFSQLVSSFFGQNILALRQEANDDALWVVLEWLEGIVFIGDYSSRYAAGTDDDVWYGQQWIPSFAHRSRVFWDLASQGWDTTLCNGGMIWNSRLVPYKNAITNELYISASIAMYLHLPHDDDMSPFEGPVSNLSAANGSGKEHNPKYLAAAVEAYKWLVQSNMTNSQGLYVDGFHISGWKANETGNTKCDERNEMVYTYNQGVLLSGLYGLYQATGARSYLDDGHELVANSIAATGWDLGTGKPSDALADNATLPKIGKWHGLGRSGILEDACDVSGSCSQDSQTFKAIYFHHLTKFCSPLTTVLATPEDSSKSNPEDTQKWHSENCARYGTWIRHNAKAALSTLNSQRKFGGWWNAPANSTLTVSTNSVELPNGAADYRNTGLPHEWILPGFKRHEIVDRDSVPQNGTSDLNDRGRGRTVETQIGGLNLLRTLWEIVDRRQL
ncbi:hypothetical protein K3495_g6479 [Podosphaera aphanis]|nr:hypothetical protein K3495_g6479 [Podosphaera aphanis]